MSNTIVIRTNIPLPKSQQGLVGKRPKSPIRIAIEQMEVGQSFIFPGTHKEALKKYGSAGSTTAKALADGRVYAIRKVDESGQPRLGIWRTA